MTLLLDTHVLLWWLSDHPALSSEASAAISDPDNVVAVSAVTIWEIVIKRALGKLEIAEEWFNVLAEEPFKHLPITWEHAKKVDELPDHHRDPFDRLLIAQALEEQMVLVTHDQQILRYELSTLKV